MTAAPLRRSLALWLSVAALAPFLTASVVVLSYLSRATVRELEEKSSLLARAVSGQVEGILREQTATVTGLRGTLLTGADQVDEEILDVHVQSARLIDSIFLLDTTGKVAAVGLDPSQRSFREDYHGLDLAHQPVCREALSRGGPAWSDTFLSILSGKMSIALCVPVGGRALLANMNIERFAELIQGFGKMENVRVSIVDRGGAIVVHEDRKLALRQVKVSHLPVVRRGLAGEEVTGSFEYFGETVIGSVARIDGPGWVALVTQNRRDALEPLVRTGWTLASAVFATILLAALFALVQSRRISGPLSELAARAGEVAEGRVEAFTGASDGSSEVRELEESFGKMLRAVQDRERLLRESEKKYRLVFEHAGEALFVAQDDRVPLVNPQALALTGLDAGSLSGSSWEQLVHPEDREALRRHYRAQLAGEKAEGTVEFRLQRSSGEIRRLEMNSVPFHWEGRPATLNFARDVTEQRRLEAQALQAQKMEAVGTLAGGIAHDFNNLLQAIQGYAELGLLPGRKDGDDRRAFQEIVKAAERGADLTRQLLTFSRKIESRRQPTNLNVEIEQVAGLLRHVLPRMIQVVFEPAADLGPVQADPAQLQQVVMNLGLNARDAMPGGGTLRIRTVAVEVGAGGWNELPEVRPGSYTELVISDTGLGIAEAVRGHIFEPFFTTKGPGQGTGLGLAMVYGIVKAHEGHITCESVGGQGATFRILFPLAVGEPSASGAVSTDRGFGGTEHILIVDDEETILRFGAKVLSSNGYEVSMARDGEEALRIYSANPGAIDLVLLDLIMPGMGGKRCLEELHRLDPAAAVLVMSGYSVEGPVREILAYGALGFVSKPFSIDRLLTTVREALDSLGAVKAS